MDLNFFTFEVDDRVFHSHHGHGTLTAKEDRTVGDKKKIDYKIEFDNGTSRAYTGNEFSRLTIPHYVYFDDGNKRLIDREDIEQFLQYVAEKKGSYWDLIYFLSHVLQKSQGVRSGDIQTAYEAALQHDPKDVITMSINRAFDLLIAEIKEEHRFDN